MTEVYSKSDEYADLSARAASPEARALIEGLSTEVEAWESQTGKRQNKRGDGTRPKFVETVERFTGNLLHAAAAKEGTGRIYRSMAKDSFSGDLVPVSFRNFQAVQEAFTALEWMEFSPGQGRYTNWGDGSPNSQRPGIAARFKATALIKRAKAAGVMLTDIDRHFRREPPEHPLTLSAGATYLDGFKLGSEQEKFERSGRALKLEEDVRELNRFLMGFHIEGGTHWFYTRGFNEGRYEQPYTWTRGGRLYSHGGANVPSYQQLNESKRALLTIDGKETCELDIQACNLTIFHGLQGKELGDGDPYERVMPDERDLVKLYMTALFGNGGPLKSWPKDAAKNFEAKDGRRPNDIITTADMHSRVIEAYPALTRLGEKGLRWPDLMYRESDVIIHTMQSLMRQGVPSLAMHDGLIVPTDAVGRATDLLIGYFHRIVGVVPTIRAKLAKPAVQAVVTEANASHRSLPIRRPDLDLVYGKDA